MHPSARLPIGWAVFFAFFFSGCAFFGQAPLDVLKYSSGERAAQHKRLIVFMRGLGGSHASFEEEGLVDDIRNRRMPYDMVAPNAHYGYYLGQTLVQRLKSDVIEPAQAAGYREIWLIGFSMGGLGSLMYLQEHPEDIQGVYLIAPFLSFTFIQDEIAAAGGLRRWNPGDHDGPPDWQRSLWLWLKQEVADNPGKNVYISYGEDDPYVKGQELLAAILPPGRVTVISGGHDYATFRNLWQALLDSGIYLSSKPEETALRKTDR